MNFILMKIYSCKNIFLPVRFLPQKKTFFSIICVLAVLLVWYFMWKWKTSQVLIVDHVYHCAVIDIFWESTLVFFVAYKPADSGSVEQPWLVQVTLAVSKQPVLLWYWCWVAGTCAKYDSGCVQILESHGIRPRSRKVMENKPNGCRISDPCTHCTCFRTLHTLSLSTVRLGSIYCLIDLVHVYENLESFNIHAIKQSWKDVENGHKWVLESPGKCT